MDLLQTEEPLPERSDLLWKHNVGEGLSNGLQAQSPNVLDPSSGEDPGHVPPAEALVPLRHVSQIISNQVPIDLHGSLLAECSHSKTFPIVP